MSKVMAAHQPNFLPYLGFFDKLAACDIFVIRDEVLFVKRDFHHRNRIRVSDDPSTQKPRSEWLTVPVEDPNDYLRHVQIKRDVKQKNMPWNKSMLRYIKSHYEKSPHFNEYFQELEGVIDNSDTNLITLNMKLIKFFANKFGLEREFVLASELGLKPAFYDHQQTDPSEDLAKISEAVEADVYLSGAGGKNYISSSPFESRGIELKFQDYHHPVYTQSHPGFLPNLASLDALFCVGKLPTLEEFPPFVQESQVLEEAVA